MRWPKTNVSEISFLLWCHSRITEELAKVRVHFGWFELSFQQKWKAQPKEWQKKHTNQIPKIKFHFSMRFLRHFSFPRHHLRKVLKRWGIQSLCMLRLLNVFRFAFDPKHIATATKCAKSHNIQRGICSLHWLWLHKVRSNRPPGCCTPILFENGWKWWIEPRGQKRNIYSVRLC